MNSLLFCSAMARAYREGRKTQTRRLFKLLRLDGSSPYGRAGDRVVLRTTWATETIYDQLRPSELPQNAKIWSYFESNEKPAECGRPRPGLFLPKKFWSRMPQPRIIRIHDECLQDISNEDAIAEGVFETPRDPGFACWSTHGMRNYHNTPRDVYKILWDEINGDGVPWKFNPRVLVVEIEKFNHGN